MIGALRRLTWPPALDWVAALLLGAGTFVFQFIHFNGLQNDHFVMIARSFQVYGGAWPVRDFFDPGMPLAYLLPAALMPVFGATVLPEVVLQTLFFAATVGITFVVSRRVSGSVVLALALSALVIAAQPRLYNGSKVLVQAVVLAAGWWYARHAGAARVAVLGACAGAAFLLRHDYAVYITAAVVPLVAVARAGQVRDAARDLAIYAAAAAVFAVPWLVYVQWVGGLVEYWQSGLRFSAAEGLRTVDFRPALPLFLLVPIAALLLARRGTPRAGGAHLVFGGVFLLIIDLALLRDGSDARIPDVVASTAMVGAAIAGALPGRAITGGGVALLAVVIAWWPLAWPLPPRQGVSRAFSAVMADIEDFDPAVFPVYPFVPVTNYLQRCTAPTTRILVVDFAPQVPVFARRPFAGGVPAWLPSYFEHESEVRTALRWLRRETVGMILMTEGADAFNESWPAVAAYFRERGYTPHTIPSDDGTPYEVWLPPPPPGGTVDRETGLPCGY